MDYAVHFRLATLKDYKALARVHCRCSKKQAGGFMHQLGESFFRAYYRTFLMEQRAVIVCAVDEQGRIVGFHSGTFKAEEHAWALRRRAMWLGLAALPAILAKPSLFWQCITRLKSLTAPDSCSRFGVREGPRGEYWAWLPEFNNPVGALECHKKWHQIMAILGAEYVRSEIDCDNRRVMQSALCRGAKILSTFKTPDGRERCVMEYDLKKVKW